MLFQCFSNGFPMVFLYTLSELFTDFQVKFLYQRWNSYAWNNQRSGCVLGSPAHGSQPTDPDLARHSKSLKIQFSSTVVTLWL